MRGESDRRVAPKVRVRRRWGSEVAWMGTEDEQDVGPEEGGDRFSAVRQTPMSCPPPETYTRLMPPGSLRSEGLPVGGDGNEKGSRGRTGRKP